jgi:hydroxymethylbilane synthase
VSPLRIGTRGSALALWQARHVQERLAALGHAATLHEITTTGDRLQDQRLEAVGGKGAFLKEIEEGLLAGEVDLAVHSLKDVPTALPGGLALVAILERADPRDVLVSSGPRLSELRAGARVGTTSLRRRSLVQALRPELQLEDLRGNVDTRLRRLREGRFDAILLAMAGLGRLGRAGEATEVLDPRQFVPAPGQGAIAIECREGDAAVRAALAPLDHPATARAVTAERAFLAALGGGCNVPLGAHAFEAGSDLELVAFVAGPDGSALLRGERRGSDPGALGRALAGDLVARGARALIAPISSKAER